MIPRLCSCQRSTRPLGAGNRSGRAAPRVFCQELVGVPGIEPGTSSLSGTRSNQLSYTPASGCRPPRPPEGWWRQPGSNRRHPACKAGALPTELCPRRGTSLSTRVQALFGGPHRAARGGCGRILSLLRFRPGGGASPRRRAPRGVPPSPRLAAGLLLRKEVIQPLVPQRLPCYDFIPITTHTLGGSPPCGLVRRLRVQTAFMM